MQSSQIHRNYSKTDGQSCDKVQARERIPRIGFHVGYLPNQNAVELKINNKKIHLKNPYNWKNLKPF